MLERGVKRHDGRPIVELEALKLNRRANKVTGIVRRYQFFVAVVKSLMKLGATSEKEHEASFLAGRMVGIVDDMVSSDFLTGNSLQTNQRYI